VNVTTVAVVSMAFLAGAALGPRVVPTVTAQFRTTHTTELLRADLGAWCEGKEVTIGIQEYGPGTSGPHYHPAHSFAWMLEGVQVKTIRGNAPVTARAGELMHEGPMEVHETSSSAPAKALVIRIAEKGKSATIRVP
jgi:quercetin dioxygenase-like cupin family protein